MLIPELIVVLMAIYLGARLGGIGIASPEDWAY